MCKLISEVTAYAGRAVACDYNQSTAFQLTSNQGRVFQHNYANYTEFNFYA